jgi:hypothetical protein
MMVLLGLIVAAAIAVAADHKPTTSSPETTAAAAARAAGLPASTLFDKLGQTPDVVYLIANSSVVFGPDPHSRSEEITFIGPVTVPKWPMQGYGRRMLPDGRQQIDIELTQSELTGESYTLGGPVVLGEHPDLRSLGTITERPRPDSTANADDAKTKDGDKGPSAEKAEKPAKSADSKDAKSAPPEEVPADFVVERKVLLTTAKGILYNETAVPVRGRIDSIPPVKFQGTAPGVNVFRGMELPVALLDKDGNVNGWFYSKTHMAYAVLPAAVERTYIKGTLQLRSGDKTESVVVSGPAEIHHLTAPGSAAKTAMEVMMLALRGHSQLLGGDIMVAESFSDRDHFSKGELSWTGSNANSKFNLFLDLYTPSAKLTTHDPLAVAGTFVDLTTNGKLEKGRLSLPLMGGTGHFATSSARVLYDETEKPSVEVVKMEFNLTTNN